MKFEQLRPLILASGSPRRREYFERYALEFRIEKSEIPEVPDLKESPRDFAVRLALEKGKDVWERTQPRLGELLVSADTIVILDGEIIGKPAGPEAVLPMLKRLNGQVHQVLTAYALSDDSGQEVHCSLTEVRFGLHPIEMLSAYAATTEPLDKAGSYSIQGVGSFLVQEIHGSYNNVVGLPMERLLPDLIKHKVIRP